MEIPPTIVPERLGSLRWADSLAMLSEAQSRQRRSTNPARRTLRASETRSRGDASQETPSEKNQCADATEDQRNKDTMRWAVWSNPLTNRVKHSGRRGNATSPQVPINHSHRIDLRLPTSTNVDGGEANRCRYNQQANHETAGTREAHGNPSLRASKATDTAISCHPLPGSGRETKPGMKCKECWPVACLQGSE